MELVLLDRSAEWRVHLLALQNQMRQVTSRVRLKLLLIRRNKILALSFSNCLVAMPMLDVAADDGGDEGESDACQIA